MRVLAAIDGSSCSHDVIDAISQRAWESGTIIKLVTVIEQSDEPYRSKGGYHRIDQKPDIVAPSQPYSYLSEFVVKLRSGFREPYNDVLVDPEVVFAEHVSDMILKLSRDWNADLIVVGTHGRSGLERIVMGSVSTSIVQRSSIPVLIARTNSDHAQRA